VKIQPFGIGAPAGGVPFLDAQPDEPSEEPPVHPVSSRAIDFATGHYVIDAAGNFESMPDLHQRVALLVSFHARIPRTIGPSFKAMTAAEVRRAIKPLTSARPPAIVIKSIEVETSAGGTQVTLVFADGQKLMVHPNGSSGT